MRKNIILRSLLLTALLPGAASALVVTPTTVGTDFTDSIAGSGVTINVPSIIYVGGATQGGLFSGGVASGIGIESGILLTSGDATGAPGPNSSTGFTGTSGTGGDADLSGLIGGTSTFDANILEFEFTTITGDLFFDFVFASEEYNEFLGFIDPFGLFVDGVNFALAPDSSPISVGNINCGPSGVDPAGPNCSSFNNNPPGTFDLQYDGFTDVFTASILGLGAGTHHMKFAISDASDSQLDSAVFIAGGSFSAVDPAASIPEPSALALMGLALAGLGLVRRRTAV